MYLLNCPRVGLAQKNRNIYPGWSRFNPIIYRFVIFRFGSGWLVSSTHVYPYFVGLALSWICCLLFYVFSWPSMGLPFLIRSCSTNWFRNIDYFMVRFGFYFGFVCRFTSVFVSCGFNFTLILDLFKFCHCFVGYWMTWILLLWLIIDKDLFCGSVFRLTKTTYLLFEHHKFTRC